MQMEQANLLTGTGSRRPAWLHWPVSTVLCLFALAWSPPAFALDAELYGRLLTEYTHEVSDVAGTRVDYRGLRASREWRQLVKSVRETSVEGSDRDATLAFWINAYNIVAIDMVAGRYPLESIRDIGSFFQSVWDIDATEIEGVAYTLGEIEHEILRPLGDPRIHAAIVCASVSCPSLRREPYEAARIEAQLDDAVRTWLSDADKGLRVEPAERRVKLSRIFDWFADDFGGPRGVIDFATRYSPPAARRWIGENRSEVTIEYFTYDWSLNDL